MHIAMIGFTMDGIKLAEKIMQHLDENYRCCCFVMKNHKNWIDGRKGEFFAVEDGLETWAERVFKIYDGLVFISAAGIAVRCIAPHIKSKTEDPAVIVVDDMGKFAISLLSGHAGGGNVLCMEIAAAAGAIPVITTSTDNHSVFAVDIFAKENGLTVSDKTLAKLVSADLLNGDEVGFFSDFSMQGNMPSGLSENRTCKHNIWITVSDGDEKKGGENTLKLIPRAITLGIGCRKGCDRKILEKFVLDELKRQHIHTDSIRCLATIDIKKNEPAILYLQDKYGWEICSYDAAHLNMVKGKFFSSEFVKSITGTDNVCERAACCAGGKLIFPRRAEDGMTIAGSISLEICPHAF